MKKIEYPLFFNSYDDLENWLDENGFECRGCRIFDTADWKYKDEQGFEHLIRNGIELTKGIKAKYIYSFRNYDWCYVDEQGFHHLYRDGVELTKGVKVVSFFPYDDGDWYYTDNMGNNHRLNSNKIN